MNIHRVNQPHSVRPEFVKHTVHKNKHFLRCQRMSARRDGADAANLQAVVAFHDKSDPKETLSKTIVVALWLPHRCRLCPQARLTFLTETVK
jgi:hypothetical protein